MHVVLLGDSIFDNARYVPGHPDVVRQLQDRLPAGAQATLLAVDGHVVEDVSRQLAGVPKDATHLVVSVGGNDALGHTWILNQPVRSTVEALRLFLSTQDEFRTGYRAMLSDLAKAGLSTAVCTVYDAVPGLEPEAKLALGLFNEVILREAFRARIPVIDLRLVCTDSSDYSPMSPIEPSHLGGRKIARAIADLVTQHDFSQDRTTIYS